MRVHEFQAKKLLEESGIAIPRGLVASSASQARRWFEELGGVPAIIKAQIHAGGRGKAGGVVRVSSADEAEREAGKLISRRLVTEQTGGKGLPVRQVLIEERVEVKQELYLGLVIDRDAGRPVMMGSSEAGVEIEKLAATSPEKIFRLSLDPLYGCLPFQARRLALALVEDKRLIEALAQVALAISRLFLEKHALLVEVNPLAARADGTLLALDAKMEFDDAALYLHPEIEKLSPQDELESSEAKASGYGLSFVALDGTIGCVVNGAGLAMATMDLIQHEGGRPANFLDVGGGANREGVKRAFEIVLADPKVKAILVNIFGGIVRCDLVAQAILDAIGEVSRRVPTVVRLEGTKAGEGKEILRSSGARFDFAEGMDEAAAKAVRSSEECGVRSAE